MEFRGHLDPLIRPSRHSIIPTRPPSQASTPHLNHQTRHEPRRTPSTPSPWPRFHPPQINPSDDPPYPLGPRLNSSEFHQTHQNPPANQFRGQPTATPTQESFQQPPVSWLSVRRAQLSFWESSARLKRPSALILRGFSFSKRPCV